MEFINTLHADGSINTEVDREYAHKNGALHAVVTLILINNKDILLAKRSEQKSFLPGLWENAASGHLSIQDTHSPALAVSREIFEELGINVPEYELNEVGSILFNKKIQIKENNYHINELVHVFTNKCMIDLSKIKLDKKEIEKIASFNKLMFIQLLEGKIDNIEGNDINTGMKVTLKINDLVSDDGDFLDSMKDLLKKIPN